MIQLEQQQHGEFVVVVVVGGWHQLPISSSLGLDQYIYKTDLDQPAKERLNLDKMFFTLIQDI